MEPTFEKLLVILAEGGVEKIPYASKAALIRLKSGSVREKDQFDVAALKQLEINPKAFD